MKTILFTFTILTALATIAQDNFKLNINKTGTTTELQMQSTLEQRYTTIAKGNFTIIDLNIEKISSNAPSRVMSDKIAIAADGKEYPCIGILDQKSNLFDNKFGGVSLYAAKRKDILVFELPTKVKSAVLKFDGQEVSIDISDEWSQSIAKPTLKVSKLKIEPILRGEKKEDVSYLTEVRAQGAFVIIDVELSFESDAGPRASDFFLLDENGVAIPSIGDLKEGSFRDNMNTGTMRLNGGSKETTTLVFPIGNLTEKDLISRYKLSYIGIASVDLK